jgi:hypothetical protein
VHLGIVKELVDHAMSDRTEEGVVTVCDLLPAGGLERVERVGIEGRGCDHLISGSTFL